MKGFTLVELLLVVAIIALAAGGTVALDRSLASGSSVRSGGEIAAAALSVAQARAAAMTDDESWSVHLASRSATVFKGTSYDDRDTAEDRTTEFPAPLTVSGTTDVVFVKGSLIPADTASTSLEADTNRWVVRVSGEGLISHGPY